MELHVTRLFRQQLVLMALGRYGYGDHVSDPEAFRLRLEKVLGRLR